jgi:predicted kinase
MDAAGAQPRVIVFSGLPGTGKSTLAEQVARTVGAPMFAGDWLMGALKPAHAALSKLDRSQYLATCYGLLGTLVTRQLMLGQSAVVDDVLRDREVVLWRETAAHLSASLFLIDCICSDEVIPPLTLDRLTVDAIEPTEDNIRRVLDYIA